MSFTQWFWKYGYFIVPLIFALIWFLGSEKFQNRGKVNPEIFQYFKTIEQQCAAEDFNNHSKACLELEKYKANCLKISSSCDSKSHYDLLIKLGYSLPPYLQ